MNCIDPLKFISAPGLAWQTALKRTEVKLELLTDVDMLLMVKKGIRGEICYALYRYAKAITNIQKIIRGTKLTISLVFITKSYFAVPKNIWLNSTYYFVVKTENKKELQHI